MSFTRSLLFILLLLIGLSTSCHDKTPVSATCTNCKSVLEAKEFFVFQPGSWWVYEEQYSGVRDSMYVYSYANGTDYQFDIVIKSALDDFEYDYWPEYNGQPNDAFCSKTKPINKKCMNIKRSKGKPGAPGVFVSESRCMFFRYNLYDSVGSNNDYYPNNFIHITNISDNFELGTYSFGTTVTVFEPHDEQENNHPSKHYFSRNVGLIKVELLDTTETWNLVDYHIEQ